MRRSEKHLGTILHKRYPELTKKMFDCSVAEGWHKLILAVVEDLHRRKFPINILQIKEKFGGLRFYYDVDAGGLADPEKIKKNISFRISALEYMCCVTCERCGNPGDLRTDLGWILTLCDECHNESLKRREEK